MIRLRLQKPLVFRPRPDRKFDPVYERALREGIAATKDDGPVRQARGPRLDEELKLHLRLDLLEAQGLKVDREAFASIYAKTRQQLLAPEVTSRMDAICAAWSQPEAQWLWERWAPPPNARTSHLASYEVAKAVLTMTAALGDIFVKKGREALAHSPQALATFETLARGTSRGDSLPAGSLSVPTYWSVTKLIKRVVDEKTPLLLQRMCVEIIRELAELFPELPIGHWVSMDGQMVAAWVRQVSGNVSGKPNTEREAWLTRRCPDAGFRVYGYDAQGIGSEGERTTLRNMKSVRGYLQVLQTETTVGLPLVGFLSNAQTTTESHGLRPLLLRLYGLWPEIPLRGVIGDKHYDTRDACLTCELDFGITPVFIRQPLHADRGGIIFARDEHDTIAWIDGWGVAYCNAHKLPMRMETLERPDRTGLLPGETSDPRRLRYRFACTAPDPCGRASFGVTRSRPDGRETAIASALVGLPHHHDSGRSDLFALRQALQAVRNSASEAAYSSLLTGYGLGGRDSKRPRIYDREALETMHWLAFATRALLTLLAHRMHADEVREHLKLLNEPIRTRSGLAA